MNPSPSPFLHDNQSCHFKKNMIIGVLKHALMITGFVLIMMLVIKYINVQTRGTWQRMLRQSRFGQYLLGAFLGVVPGCLGAFTVVSLYSHRTVSRCAGTRGTEFQ